MSSFPLHMIWRHKLVAVKLTLQHCQFLGLKIEFVLNVTDIYNAFKTLYV